MRPVVPESDPQGSAQGRVEKMNVPTANQMVIGAMEILEQAKWVARVDDRSEEHRGVNIPVGHQPGLDSEGDVQGQARAIIEAKKQGRGAPARDSGVEVKVSRVKVA